MVLIVVGILVAVAVAELLHQLGRGIAQMQRHRQIARLLHKAEGTVDTHIGRVALGTRSQIYRSLGKGNTPLGPAYLHHRIEGCIGDEQGIGIGQSDILRGRDDESASDERGVFATLYHAGKPVKCSVGVAATDRLDIGRDDIVVHLAILVVGERILLQTLGDNGIGDDHLITIVGLDHQFERVEQLAGIASREAQQGIGLTDGDAALLQVGILRDGAVEEFEQVVLLQRLQYIELAARE